MIPDFMRYLPEYLDGSNVRAHAGVVDNLFSSLDGKIELLRDWNLLERPILIEYSSQQVGAMSEGGCLAITSNLILYFRTETPIQKITVQGEITDTITFNEDITTSYTKQYTNTKVTDLKNFPSVDEKAENILPHIVVTVYTTDNKVYKKGYPENDTIEGDIYDHDEFLDIIGNLLNLPRRKYKKFKILLSEFYKTVPPFFAKQARATGYYDKYEYDECTEDDYYYMQRIKRICNKATIINYLQQIYGENTHFFARDYAIPTTVHEGNINLSLTADYSVPNIDYLTNESFVASFLPLTRDVYFHQTTPIYTLAADSIFVAYPNYFRVYVRCNHKSAGRTTYGIMRLPVKVRFVTNGDVLFESGILCTDDDGFVEYIRGGLFVSNSVSAELVLAETFPEFPPTISNDRYISTTMSSVFTLVLDAWDYVKLQGTPVTDESLVLPSLDSNDYLSMGRGYLTYTPAIDFSLVDVSAYTLLISFHAGGSEQRLGLVEVNTTNGSVSGEWVVLDDYLTNYSYNTTHTLAYKFLNGVAYVYLDGVYTGLYKDYSSYTEGMLYVAGYNPNDTTGNGGLYIGSVSVDNTAGITVAPSTIVRHNVTLSVPDTTAVLGDTTSILATLLDENNDNVTDGILDWTIYTEHNITLDISDWSYAKMNGTSVPDASLIAPTVANGELSTGLGNVVYYNTPLPDDLSEYTLRCKVHGTRLYNRIGISTITTNNDSTISIDITKVSFLRDITSVVDDSTTYELEFKFLNNICYIYCDNSYTGISANYTGINDDLYLVAFSNSSYNNAITPVVIEELSYVDCVDLNNIPTGGGAMIKTLNTDISSNWTSFVPVKAGTSATITPTMNTDGTRQLGQRYTNILTDNTIITDGSKKYNLYIDIHNLYCYIGIVNANNIQNDNSVTQTTPAALGINDQGVHKFTISFHNDKVYITADDTTTITGNLTNVDKYLYIYPIGANVDKLLRIEEEDVTE